MSFFKTFKSYSKKLHGKKLKIIEDKAITQIKARINIKKIIESQEDYYKPARVGYFWNNNYIEYESSSEENKTLLVKEYRYEIKPYLKDIINNF